MIFTLFMSPLHSAFPDNVDDPSESKIVTRLDDENKFNILYKKIEQFELDDTDTRAISFANYTRSDWSYLIVRVIGSARINTAGKDTDGSSAITGKLPMYGTDIFPGIGLFSSYNVDTFTVESLADSTKIELFAAISCADDDTRIDDND